MFVIASIHPCQHAAAMLRIIEALSDCGKTPNVKQYMFIFLKFMQSVMPTIEYDYTFDVQVRGK
jgi:ubiquitin-like-conjugating enzyme ATG3